MLAKVESLTRKQLDDNEVGIVQTPDDIDIKELISMAVNKKKPFVEKGEKGFRDTIILKTILSHAKGQGDVSHILVANDRIFSDSAVVDTINEAGIELVTVGSLKGANVEFEEFAKKVNIFIESYEKLILRTYLMSEKTQILEFVKGVRIPDSFLNQGMRLLSRPLGVDNLRIDNINQYLITRSNLFKGASEGRVKISFTVKCTIEVRLFTYALPPEKTHSVLPDITRPTNPTALLLVGTGGGLNPFQGSSEVGQNTVVVEDINIAFLVDASARLTKILERGIPQDSYSDLKLENAVSTPLVT